MSNAPKKSAAKKSAVSTDRAKKAAPKKAGSAKGSSKQIAAGADVPGEADPAKVSGPGAAVLIPAPGKRSRQTRPRSVVAESHAGDGAVSFDGIIVGTNG